ncbi:MAG TPA: hypothetical protein VHD90_14295 [Phototrophicaceae bacterium]|nr:hypothetical protein [Phototrophicaceae bacterium]
MPRNRYDDWIDDDEYPDDRDVEEFGDDSPVDYDPRTIGYVGKGRPGFWTRQKIILLVIIMIVLAAIFLPQVIDLLR